MAATNDIGYYTLPVILSFEGVEKQVTSKLTKAFGDVGKKSSKAMADATEADVNRAAASYGKLRDKASDALGKVRVEEEKLKKAREGGKADQIVAAEERLNKARRDSASANRAAADSYKDLERAQGSVGSKTGNLGMEFGKLSDLAGKAGTAMVAAGVTAAAAATVGIAALAAGVIAAGREIYDLGAQWDEVTDKLSIKTAKIGPDLDKLKTAVKDLAPSTASSINDIGGVVGSVSQALRLTGQDLTAVSKTILDLNRLTGEELNIRELGKVFRGFGVDATQQVATLDSLYRASAATGMSVNELVAAIGQNGPALRTMGLNLSQGAALLGSFEVAGLDGTKAMGALSLAAKNLAKDGKAPAEGLRDTVTEIDKLLKAGRTPDAINLATKIFGRGFTPILDAIRSGALDAQSLNDALATGGITINELAKSTADWEERWQKLKNTLSVALEPIATGVFNLVNEKLTGFADWITQNQSKVIGFFGAVADFAFNAAKSVVSFVADSLRALGTLIERVAPALSDIGGAISWIPGLGKAGQGLKDLGKAMESWPTALNSAADTIETKLNGALQKGQTYADAFIKRTQLATKFTEVLGDVVATLNEDGEIVLSDNTPELQKKLKDLNIKITELPDGSIGVTADTAEAQTILDNYRDQEQGKPIEIPVKPDTKPGTDAIDQWKRYLEGKPIKIPVSTDPFNPGGVLGDVPTPGSGPRKFAPSSSTNSDRVAEKIIAEASRRGLNKEQTLAALATALQETDLGSNPRTNVAQNQNGTVVQGLYQQDASYNKYGDRTNIDNAIAGFIDQYVTRGPGLRGDPWQQALAVQVPASPSNGGYDANTLRNGQRDNALDVYNRVTGGGGGGGGMRRFANMGAAADPGVVANVNKAAEIAAMMPFGLQLTSGRRDEPGSYHNIGLAGDFSNGTNLTPQMRAFAEYMSTNFGDQIAELIYGDPNFKGNIGGPYSDKTLSEHMNHVHIAFKPGASLGGGRMRRFGPGGQPMDMSNAIDTSALYMQDPAAGGSMSPYGPDYLPGVGTPGVNDQGEPGYYQPDAKKVREADEKVRDAEEKINRANAAVNQAQARLNELPYGAEESQRLSAAESLRAAKYEADKAVRERNDALKDLADTQKGDFTAAKNRGKNGKGGGKDQLGGLGSIFSSFLKDTFGFGDFLPALDNFWPLQAADSLLTFGLNTANAWQDPANADATSNSPYGIPDIPAPPMPEGNQHTGAGGAPGPATVVNVDQSQNFNNSPLGWDPAQVGKERDRAINRAPRLPVGTG